MNLYELADTWKAALKGTEVSGTVTDPESGEEAAFHLRCSAVSYCGIGDRIAIVWDDLLSGGYRRWERTGAQMAGESMESLSAALIAGVEAGLADDLAARRYDGLVGEEL